MTAAAAEDPAAAPVASCRDVTKVYGRGAGRWYRRRAGPEVVALDGVSLDVSPGEFVGLTGPSGSGKSTLLHLLAGLDTPTSGRVDLVGEALSSAGERARARLRLEHVGIVFQRFHLLASLTARSNVALPLVELGLGRRERRERAEAVLDRVGLADRAGHRPGELSGGEAQRVAVARALVADPDLVLADEPTGELDSEAGARVVELLADVATDRAVLVASHDPAVVDAADRTHRLRDGALVG